MSIKIGSHINARGGIIIPVHIRRALQLDAGTEIWFTVNKKNQIIITRKEPLNDAK